MNRKCNVLLLTALMSAATAGASTPKPNSGQGDQAPQKKQSALKFQNDDNIKLMEMLTKLVRMKREREISLLVRALASAHKADELRKKGLEAEAFDDAAKKLVGEMVVFFELLNVVRTVVEESFERSTIANIKEDRYSRRKPFLVEALDMSREAQIERLEQATTEMRREVILEVAAVLEVLKHNMSASVKKAVFPLVEKHLADEKQADQGHTQENAGKSTPGSRGTSQPEIEA